MMRVKLSSDVSLSQIIYGMWRLGDDADQSESHVIAKIESCLAQGITTFDQADIYGDYLSESLLGKALKKAPNLREKMEIVTKCNIKLLSDKFPDRRVKYYDTSRAHIQSSVEKSLVNMNIEQIDVLLLHRPDPLMNAQETGATLDNLVRSGKVKTVGVSNFKYHDWDLLQSTMETSLQTNQIEISLLERSPFTNGDLAFMQRMRVPVMAWSPLAGGELFSSNEPEVTELRAKLTGIAKQFSVGEDAVAIAWLLYHPASILPILGTNNLDRIGKLSDALKVQFDRETWYELYTIAMGQEVP